MPSELLMKHSKGLELPINTIVIVAIAVLVLVVAAALFTTNVSVQSGALSLETAYAQGCQTLRTTFNCQSNRLGDVNTNYVPSGQENTEKNRLNLRQICQRKNWDDNTCAKNCGCP